MTRLLLAALLFAGCTETRSDLGPNEETATHRLRFEAEAGDSYSFTLERSCECLAASGGPFRIVVTDGEVASATDRTGAAVSGEIFADLPTIADIFDRIDEAYDRPADAIEVQFDATTGYPASVNIDYSVQIADEEYTVTVSDVEALRAD